VLTKNVDSVFVKRYLSRYLNLDARPMKFCLSHFTVALFLLAFSGCADREVPPPSPIGPVPTDSQMAWHEMELNAFIHFTTNTFTDKEWGYGDESPAVFNPEKVNVEQWMSTLKATGFKGVILTTKHHDGFCLWPSQYTEHSVKNSPYKGDVVKEVSDACKRHGLKFGVYLSPWDRNRADYGTPSYIDYYRAQLKELFTNYGPVFEMWFDGANGGDGYYGGANERRRIDGATYYEWPATLDTVREIEPDVIFFSDAGPGVRWVGNERGIAGETNWNTITPDTLYAGKAGIESLLNSGAEGGTHWIPAETDVSIRPGWFYHASEDSLVKSPEKLFDIYLTSVGRGSTLLLNIPPDRRGVLHENDVAALNGFRTILDSVFAKDLAAEATVEADNYRGGISEFSPQQVADGNKESYWATDDGVSQGSIRLQLKESQRIRYVVLQEYIRLGQRIKKFTVDAWRNGKWEQIAEGTTVGYKRILPVDVETDKIRVNFLDSRGPLVISSISLF